MQVSYFYIMLALFVIFYTKTYLIVSSLVQAPLVDSLKVHPYRSQFTKQSKIAIDNIFADHTARRYANGCAQKHFISVASTSAVTKVVIINANTTALTSFVGWSIFGLASISLLAIGGLILFQRAERKRYGYVDQDFIETTARPIDEE